jgi:hypothetical protein
MIVMESRVAVPGMTGHQVTDFLLDCTDERYQAWWPGTHLRMHLLSRGRDHIGDVVLMDEYVGRRRLRMTGVVREAVPGRRIVWQFRKGIPLPARLTLTLAPTDDGVAVGHAVTAGFAGPGRLLDPLIRRYLSPRFAADLDRHVHCEFVRLRDLLVRGLGASGSAGGAGDPA